MVWYFHKNTKQTFPEDCCHISQNNVCNLCYPHPRLRVWFRLALRFQKRWKYIYIYLQWTNDASRPPPPVFGSVWRSGFKKKVKLHVYNVYDDTEWLQKLTWPFQLKIHVRLLWNGPEMLYSCFTSPSSFKLNRCCISLYSKWACVRWNNCAHVRNNGYLQTSRTINVYNTKTSSRKLFPGEYLVIIVLLWFCGLSSRYLRGSYFPENIR